MLRGHAHCRLPDDISMHGFEELYVVQTYFVRFAPFSVKSGGNNTGYS